jgi:phage gpG-like protein
MARPRNAIDFSVETAPRIETIQFNLSGAAQQLRTFRKPLEMAVRRVLSPRLYQNFDTNGAKGTWTPLAASTVKWKMANGFSRVAFEPLKRTGRLQKTAGQVNLWKVGSDNVELAYLTGDAAYGIYHQDGYTNARTGRKVPARPWAELLDSDVDQVGEIIESHAWLIVSGI